jgi:hypothetical protein
MMYGSLVLALVSTGAAVLNGIGLLMTWMKYRSLAYESLIFASEVFGSLHDGEEDYPPPDLAAGALSFIGKISSKKSDRLSKPGYFKRCDTYVL